MVTAAKNVGHIGMHMTVAFNVMYISTGSVALGGLAAVFEPIRNVMLLPLKAGKKIVARLAPQNA